MRLDDGTVYLDTNATTPLDPEVLRALGWAAQNCFGNPSSVHRPGVQAREILNRGRASLADLVGCEPEEIIYTASGTEANHLAFHSVLSQAGAKRRVLLSAVEHPSVLAQWDMWVDKGFELTEIPVDESGRISPETLANLMDDRVALVSVMTAHNETGVLQPLQAVGEICRAHGCLFHTDAVQAMGKVPSPWETAYPDYLTLSGHKFYAPKGVGALAVRTGAPVEAMLWGGGQEGGHRASTEAVPLVHALATAAQLASEALGSSGEIQVLRDGLEETLERDYGAVVFGKDAPRLPNTSFFSLPGVKGAEAATALDEMGVFVATGSACNSGEEACPAVLLKMGVSLRKGHGILRVSLGRHTKDSDVNFRIESLDRYLKTREA